MSESVPGEKQDGVVYRSKGNFKMKPGVTTVPVAASAPRAMTTPTPPPTATPPHPFTPPPILMTRTPPPAATMPPGAFTPTPVSMTRTPTPVSSPGRAFTPPPILTTRTPRPSIARSRPPTSGAQPAHGVVMTKTAIAGLCLITFSCGIICSVSLYRFAPHLRPDCGGGAVVAAGDPVPRAPAPAGETAVFQSARAENVPDPMPPPSPPAPPAAAPAPAAPVAVPISRARAAPTRPPSAARPAAAPAAGRSDVHRRVSSPGAGNASLPPTGIWIDPFAE